MTGGPTRRTLLLAAGGAVLVGCSDDEPAPTPGRPAVTPTFNSPTTSSSTSPDKSATPTTPTPSPAPSLPSVPTWRVNANDVQPAAKTAAVAAVVARLTAGKQSAIEIIDAQYGGILSSTASVLVACRQYTLGTGGRVSEGGTTVDVRLVREGGRWRVTALYPARPGTPAKRLTELGRQVVTNERIELPPASKADIESGQVHDSVLRALVELSRTYTIGVSVIRSGHPQNVFGTDRPSDHPRGRAFDTWRINGRAVVDEATPRGLVTGFMRAAAAAGSYNVGGPYQLSGAARYFSDATHHDHVHAGFQS